MAYATTSEVKEFLGIEGTNLQNDNNLQIALDAASKLIDNETGRIFTLASSATARTFVPTGDDTLTVDDIGSTTGLVVELGSFGSTTWTATTDYELNPLNAITQGRPATGLVRPSGWGYSSYSRVRVTAKWGYPTTPSEVEQATILQAARLWKRKDSPGGVYGSSEWGFSRVSKVDPDVMALIQHLVVPGFGG